MEKILVILKVLLNITLILQGGYYCDFCASGYMGTNRTGCYLDDFCTSGVHTCDTTKADCVYLGPAQFRCKVGLPY